MHTVEIVAVSANPGLAPLVADWIVDAFFSEPGGYTTDEMTAIILARRPGPCDTFVLFDGRHPVATAGFSQSDLDTRPDLSPWLVGVWVNPAYRGRGHAATLVRWVEGVARWHGIETLWLYTTAAEGLYLKLGWTRAGLEREGKRDAEVVLMRRDLAQRDASGPPAVTG